MYYLIDLDDFIILTSGSLKEIENKLDTYVKYQFVEEFKENYSKCKNLTEKLLAFKFNEVILLQEVDLNKIKGN